MTVSKPTARILTGELPAIKVPPMRASSALKRLAGETALGWTARSVRADPEGRLRITLRSIPPEIHPACNRVAPDRSRERRVPDAERGLGLPDGGGVSGEVQAPVSERGRGRNSSCLFARERVTGVPAT